LSDSLSSDLSRFTLHPGVSADTNTAALSPAGSWLAAVMIELTTPPDLSKPLSPTCRSLQAWTIDLATHPCSNISQKSYTALCGVSFHVPSSNVGSQNRPQDQDEGYNHKERLLPGISSPVPILNCSWSRLAPDLRAALRYGRCKCHPRRPCIHTGKLNSRGRLPFL
jgi:hypothetical protein